MVPILKKSSGSREEITNYRGRALSSLLSKIFDNCIINQYDSLFTNDLQFAYKSKTSTIHCVSSISETANHYVVCKQCRSSTGMHVRRIKSIS